jgi:hypothetical protein
VAGHGGWRHCNGKPASECEERAWRNLHTPKLLPGTHPPRLATLLPISHSLSLLFPLLGTAFPRWRFRTQIRWTVRGGRGVSNLCQGPAAPEECGGKLSQIRPKGGFVSTNSEIGGGHGPRTESRTRNRGRRWF